MSTSPTIENAPAAPFICACEDFMRSACAGEGFYQAHEGKPYCVLHYPGNDKGALFDKALDRKLKAKDFNFSGVWFHAATNFSGIEFSTRTNFSSATFNRPVSFVESKFNAEANFKSALFKEGASFYRSSFGGKAQFVSTRFYGEVNFAYVPFKRGADFSQAIFGKAAFGKSSVAFFNWANFHREASFADTKFMEASFKETKFRREASFRTAAFNSTATFQEARFYKDADFDHAIFYGLVTFYRADFRAKVHFIQSAFATRAGFNRTLFRDSVRFEGTEDLKMFEEDSKQRNMFSVQSSLDLQDAEIIKPRRVAFDALTLRPHWFVKVNPRHFDFTNVSWATDDLNEEINSLETAGISHPREELAIACRRLADNAEENHRYEEASGFRYMAMDTRRLKNWRGLKLRRLSWWYWLASGYGERVGRAFVVLMAVMFLFAGLYVLTGHIRVRAWGDVLGAVNYSLSVMALQKPEPRAVAGLTPLLVTFETILGPVQAALLALAIRRKFMR